MQDSILRKVIALLDKAEATSFPEEAEAFTAKAQALISRHGIESAVAEARSGNRATEEVTTITITVKAPYVRPKMAILSNVAKANRCRGVMFGKDKFLIVGFPSDLEVVEMLSASLLIQATRAMDKATKVYLYDDVKAFRNAFLIGFSHEIGVRLEEAAANARRDVEDETGTSVALVLRDRKGAIDDFFNREFPEVRQVSASVSNGIGVSRGRAAGANADIGNKRVGSRRALGAGR